MRHTETVIRMHQPQQTATPATTAKPTNAELKEQITQTIIDAQQAARDAKQAARDAARNGAVPATPLVPGGAYTIQNDGFGAERFEWVSSRTDVSSSGSS